MSSQSVRPYGTAMTSPASSPQPYGTAIPMQMPARPQPPPSGPYSSGSAPPPPPQRPTAPSTPYRPIQAGPNSLQGYSPSLARGYGNQTPAQAPAPAQMSPQATPGYTPQQQQLLAMRQQQMMRTATTQEDASASPFIRQPTQAPLFQAITQPKTSPPAPLLLERTFNPLREPNAAWSVQGVQAGLGMAVQGGSLVFQQAGVVAIYVTIQNAKNVTLLRVVNPLTHDPLAFSYADATFAYLSLVKPVDAGEAWQVQTQLSSLPDSEEQNESVKSVTMIAQVMRLA